MRYTLFALLAAVAMSAAAPLPASDTVEDPQSLAIEAGRLGVMMDQGARIMKFKAAAEVPEKMDSGEDPRANTRNALISAVLRYNAVVAEACRHAIVKAKFCAGPYLPVWLGEPAGTSHSDAALRAMVDDASGRLVPLWSELCEIGRRAAPDQDFCAIE